ncbi:glycerophosphodiester phosphodiesterase [bacterium]|nr:MAG: glycerophosphodiester phosphodiesterase [bacterium]
MGEMQGRPACGGIIAHRIKMKPLIIAHRGASAYARENTLEAFRIAMEMGADMIEFDVRRTGDDVLILSHDDNIEGKLVKDLTYDEIHGIAMDAGYLIPTLEETFEFTKGKIRLDIELKEDGFAERVAELAMKSMETSDFVITSSLDSAVKAVKGSYPNVRTGLVLGSRPLSSLPRSLFPQKRVRDTDVDILAVDRKLLRLGFLKTVKRLGLPVFVWTVNDRKLMGNLLSTDGVAGIFTDKPDVALFLREMILRER